MRASRALFVTLKVGQPPEEHAPRSADLAWLYCGRTRGTLLPTPLAWARTHQHRGRLRLGIRTLVIPASEFRGARRARTLPRKKSVKRLRSTLHTAARTWLGRPTRGALLPTPSAGARPHHYCDRFVARHSSVRYQLFRNPWGASRALSPRGKSANRPRSTRRAARTWRFGVVVLSANAGRALPHAVGRGSTALSSRQVGGTAFKRSLALPSNPVARVARALRYVENRPTACEARSAQRGLGMVVL